uniref:Uncharacterized protein n=1 Tax=Catharus ustulatus TaxID=91951 RepID=A0A8C3UNX7_CATUS
IKDSYNLLCRSADVEARGLGYDVAKETEKKEQRTDPKISSVPISNTLKGQLPKELHQQGALRDNSALSSQGRCVETALDELWPLELPAHVPEVHAKNDNVLDSVNEPSIVALDRWDVFPDTKNQLGFVEEQGQELKAQVPHETEVHHCPDLGKKRQGRDRALRKAGTANMNKAKGDQENEQFRSSAVTPESPENFGKTEWDLPCVSKPPIERISASGQAGSEVFPCTESLFWAVPRRILALWNKCHHSSCSQLSLMSLSLCCCILGLALTLLFSADTIAFVI